jgi:hypothetical protein
VSSSAILVGDYENVGQERKDERFGMDQKEASA